MNLKDTTRGELVDYVAAQVNNHFPDRHRADVRAAIDRDLDTALDRLDRCIGAVRMWKPGEFHYLHSEQNCTFLYFLANTIWRNRGGENVCTKLFYLNKSLNGFHCFYDTELPEKFFIGHSLGIVLVRTTYPDYFAIYQNCTVGKNHGEAPELEEGIVMYPGSAIIGRCKVRPRSYLAKGCALVNTDTPGDCLVFQNGPGAVFKAPKRDILADIFRL